MFFFDTPDLRLNQAGVVVRARRAQVKGDDSVVKLRPVVPARTSGRAARGAPGFGVEVDAMPGGYVCSGTLKHTHKRPIVRETLLAGGPVHKLFSKSQRTLYAEHAPEGIELDDLAILGPIFVLKLKYRPEGYRQKLVAELWLYPDGSRILELSTKCDPTEAFDVAAALACVPHGARRGPHRRPGDEDAQGARVLLRPAAGWRRLAAARFHPYRVMRSKAPSRNASVGN